MILHNVKYSITTEINESVVNFKQIISFVIDLLIFITTLVENY